MFHLCSVQALPLTSHQIIYMHQLSYSLTMCVWCKIPQHPLRNIQEEAHIRKWQEWESDCLKLHEIMYYHGKSLFIFEQIMFNKPYGLRCNRQTKRWHFRFSLSLRIRISGAFAELLLRVAFYRKRNTQNDQTLTRNRVTCCATVHHAFRPSASSCEIF